jgi:hypothetical protein
LRDNKKILVLIYSHPEYYPPTLNAIEELSKTFKLVRLIYRPFLKTKWKFADNVILKSSGKSISRRDSMNTNFIAKIFFYVQYTWNVLFSIITKKYDTILVYDHLPMLSLYIIRPILNKKTLLWYHNHDVPDSKNLKKYSLGWGALKSQDKLLKYLDLFTLPSAERIKHFNIAERTKVFVIPNYPSKKRYSRIIDMTKQDDQIELIYQGTISTGHGLEEITHAINTSKELLNCNLKLIGHISSEFKRQLENQNIKNKIDYKGYIPYSDLPDITTKCHIGLAINIPKEIIYQTGGSASNKIYEYAACGLPILYFDDPHYNAYLSKYEWAFATDLTVKSIEKCILEIMKKYEYLSKKAKTNFETKLNFETAFEPIKKFLETK